MQPTFMISLPAVPDEAMREIRRAISSPDLKGHAVAAGHVVDFKVPQDQRRFWSPHLSAQLYEAAGDTSCDAYCRFSPRPEIWTMFMAMYFAASCFIFAAAIWGYVQWFMGLAPWALVVIPICVIVIAVLHVASLIGQSLSADQMHDLRARFDRAIELAFAPETPADASTADGSPVIAAEPNRTTDDHRSSLAGEPSA